MKQLTILLLSTILFIGIPTKLYAQTEFSKSGTQWIINVCEDYIWDGYKNNYTFNYILGKDTILLEETWKILYKDSIAIGAFLEEGPKIYYYSFFWPEKLKAKKRLCYDFSKEKGDTIYYQNWLPDGKEEGLGYIYANTQEAREEGADGYNIVSNVTYNQGRKIIDIGEETWIEGIGSTRSFFYRYMLIPLGYCVTSHALHEVIHDHTVIYYMYHLINPNAEPSFLFEGKSWHIIDENDGSIYRATIGKPYLKDYFPRYPVLYEKLSADSETYFPTSFGSTLIEINNCVYWSEIEYQLLYNFNLEKGQKISLCKEYYNWPLHRPSMTEEDYRVSQIDSVDYNGTKRKRLILEGADTLIWIEGIGSLKDPLYPLINTYDNHYFNKIHNKVTCCYQNNELLYQNPDYKDCTTPRSSVEQHSLPSEFYCVNGNRLIIWEHEGYRLSFYNSAGVLIHTQKLNSREERIALPTLSTGILIGKLENGKQPALHFKIPLSGL